MVGLLGRCRGYDAHAAAVVVVTSVVFFLRGPRLVKTPLLPTSGLIGRCCWQHPNTKTLLVERPHARCYLNKTRTWIKVLAVATIDAAVQ